MPDGESSREPLRLCRLTSRTRAGATRPFFKAEPCGPWVASPLRSSQVGLNRHGERSEAIQGRRAILSTGLSGLTNGADGGGRTRTALRPRDFKSLASTGFATSAWAGLLSHFLSKMKFASSLPAGAKRPAGNDKPHAPSLAIGGWKARPMSQEK